MSRFDIKALRAFIYILKNLSWFFSYFLVISKYVVLLK